MEMMSHQRTCCPAAVEGLVLMSLEGSDWVLAQTPISYTIHILFIYIHTYIHIYFVLVNFY